jgi:hypothetical protein
MTTSIQLRNAGDVVAAIPALLGFHPASSVVALWIGEDSGQLLCLMRTDIDTPDVELSRLLLAMPAKTGPGSLLLVIYPQNLNWWGDSTDEKHLLAALEDVRDHITIRDVVLVSDGRWWSQMCTDPTCCPVGGTQISDGVSTAEAVRAYQGSAGIARSRDMVRERYSLRTTIPSIALESAEQNTLPSLEERCLGAMSNLTELTYRTDDEALARVCVALQDVDVRDWVLSRIAAGGKDEALQLTDALIDVALRSPRELRSRPAGAAAFALALDGSNPVGVWAMVDHAKQDSLARLIAEAMTRPIPPDAIKDLMKRSGEELVSGMAMPTT